MMLELAPCKVFVYRGFTVVPHYTKRNTFVGPGGFEVSLSKLDAIDALHHTQMLWVRPWAVQANLQKGK